MPVKNKGFPEEDDIVMCTVSSVQHHSVFAKLDEYENKSGLIHISEISPGRIRNIRDYVEEGKKVVCKVLRIDKEKGHIDLSLRRVTEMQKKKKTNEIKQEQNIEKIIEFVASKTGNKKDELYRKIYDAIIEYYDTIYGFFEAIVAGEDSLESLNLDTKTQDILLETIKQRIKEKEVEISGKISITSYEPDGVETVKSILNNILKVNEKQITITYNAAGKYRLSIKSSDYKDAEKILKKVTDILDKKDYGNTKINFVRDEKSR